MRLPGFVTELSPVRETLAAIQAGETAMETAVEEKNAQLCVATATEGLELWEADYGLSRQEGTQERRRAVLAAMAGGRTLTPALLRELCVRLGGADRGEVTEDFPHWQAEATAVSRGHVPGDLTALRTAVETLKPAHLEVTVTPGADLEAARQCGAHGCVMMEIH